MLPHLRFLICACATLASTTVSAMQRIRAYYTSSAEAACKDLSKNSQLEGMPSLVRSCPGRVGYVVRISEDDLRETVSVGRTVAAAAKQPAANQSFGPFNSAGAVIEWRVDKTRPFAIIQRWKIQDVDGNPDAKGHPPEVELLVVTRLPPGPVCHTAYIDVAANPNSNTLARRAADENAERFACGSDPVVIVGNPGRATELAKPPH